MSAEVEQKTCSRCGFMKPTAEFSPNPHRRDGRYPYCKPCKAAYMRERYEKNREQEAEKDYRRRITRYGITPEAYDTLLREQAGLCAICGTDDPGTGRTGRMAIDHDHETGLVRGLLCGPCNRAIGLLGDDPQRLLSAAAYLTQHSSTPEPTNQKATT